LTCSKRRKQMQDLVFARAGETTSWVRRGRRFG
jgi:hypothetical protein